MKPDFVNTIFDIADQDDFQRKTLEIFNYQAENNQVYKDFIKYIGIEADSVCELDNIPFLPVSFFKNHKVVSGVYSGNLVFDSSGTNGKMTSRHYVKEAGVYEKSLLRSFRLFYGDPGDYMIAALLPSYTERENSSLIYMVNRLIEKSNCHLSGYYMENVNDLLSKIKAAKTEKGKVLLIGVSFALLDLAEKYSPDLSGVIVMETGGMKGRRREMTREELHSVLRQGLNVNSIHSEYGMTELLSQAYSKRDGIFYCPPWMKVLIRDPQDPLSIMKEPGKTGGINIIDLANVHSCSFIATDDLGKLYANGSFEVLGRFDSSDIRGCNLMFD
jgi:phenylacetate-coenzyme A ligase PaaK-like adenylate-forming protein